MSTWSSAYKLPTPRNLFTSINCNIKVSMDTNLNNNYRPKPTLIRKLEESPIASARRHTTSSDRFPIRACIVDSLQSSWTTHIQNRRAKKTGKTRNTRNQHRSPLCGWQKLCNWSCDQICRGRIGRGWTLVMWCHASGTGNVTLPVIWNPADVGRVKANITKKSDSIE